MITFLVGGLFGAVSLWAFLEWQEWKESNQIDVDDDDELGGG